MAEELGKIEKPQAASFKKGRKLFFVPLLFSNPEPPEEYSEKFTRYWEQVAKQIDELLAKLGPVNRIYHELVAEPGEAGSKAISELNEKSYSLVKTCLEKKAQLEALEESDILMEFMDWNRCLLIGLQNPKVLTRVYEAYIEAGKKRNECIARRIDETLKSDEIGLLLMRENHQVQFPPDIQVFYVAPPALDEIKRWLREREQKPGEEEQTQKE
jgi:hypothetical protein